MLNNFAPLFLKPKHFNLGFSGILRSFFVIFLREYIFSGEGERNFGDKSLAFSTAGSVFGGAGDVSRHETDFVEEDNLQEDGNILNSILSHSKQFLVLHCFSSFFLL